jgi:hypothetical protein
MLDSKCSIFIMRRVSSWRRRGRKEGELRRIGAQWISNLHLGRFIKITSFSKYHLRKKYKCTMVKPVSEASFITNIIQLAQTNSQQNMVNYKVRGSSRRKGDCGIGCTTVKPAPGTWSIKTSIGHLATKYQFTSAYWSRPHLGPSIYKISHLLKPSPNKLSCYTVRGRGWTKGEKGRDWVDNG